MRKVKRSFEKRASSRVEKSASEGIVLKRECIEFLECTLIHDLHSVYLKLGNSMIVLANSNRATSGINWLYFCFSTDFEERTSE